MLLLLLWVLRCPISVRKAHKLFLIPLIRVKWLFFLIDNCLDSWLTVPESVYPDKCPDAFYMCDQDICLAEHLLLEPSTVLQLSKKSSTCRPCHGLDSKVDLHSHTRHNYMQQLKNILNFTTNKMCKRIFRTTVTTDCPPLASHLICVVDGTAVVFTQIIWAFWIPNRTVPSWHFLFRNGLEKNLPRCTGQSSNACFCSTECTSVVRIDTWCGSWPTVCVLW